MVIEDLQIYLPRAFCGLVGHVPMSKTVQAFIAFFNSSTFDEVPFGLMKQLVTTILDSTTRDVTNLLQMTRIAESGRFSEQAELGHTRRRAIIGGLPGASCCLSGKKLGRDSRVLFREENKEYAFEAIKLDPEENPSQSVYGQRHRKLFHEEGLSYELGDSTVQEMPQVDAAYEFLHFQFSSIR
ncbi:unnamed protein product [Oikopleura dioica]|uniref:Uncharacterized protein n=1 Tax=Oikopleura dioica TaxID=34765 RepID=E4X7A9_OIKDI|nr:unnamed protein product [Oikopleura dioica]